eukprot:TRINITY_DN128_c0_g1_i1.p1 TRINITY_DN128_c0_g1~~TRINITY_DN128_c0_g1_i1.p1  ORF type:complete len:255 (-),score=55.00 TRINITY_DN128_c0_g1_i1:81-845(-)
MQSRPPQGYPGSPGGYPPQGQQGGYPPQGQQGGYPPQGPGGYPPQQGGYPPQGQQGGYPPQGGQAPPAQYGSQYYYNMIPPQELQKLQASFAALDKDKSGEISAAEIATTTFGSSRFSQETAQLLVKVFDKDRSGQISFFEYASLYKFIETMQAAYAAYDRDRSGTIDFPEVVQSVHQGGFQISQQTLQQVFNKFLRHPTLNPGMRLRGLNLELFIQLCAYLGCARGVFAQFDYQRSGWVYINLDQFITMSLAF